MACHDQELSLTNAYALYWRSHKTTNAGEICDPQIVFKGRKYEIKRAQWKMYLPTKTKLMINAIKYYRKRKKT